ncbi:MAG: hypothetical protein KF891_24715 [Rhizobacter sp.]|nr:hypothetical protein [Rhizobacter sp.]
MKDKSREAEKAPAEATPRGAGAEVKSEQYGRRADPKYAQINANIPADLRRELRVKLAGEEREQQEVLEALIRGYLDGRFKV